MQLRACTVTAVTLSTAMAFGISAMAADLPKAGTFRVTFSGFNAPNKPIQIGKDRVIAAWDDNGLTVGEGLLDHMTWHCFGLYEVANSMAWWHGYCVATDPAGDQIAINATSEMYPADAKSYTASCTFTAGTGKYTGISGDYTFAGHGPEFRVATEGAFAEHGEINGSYKLP